MKKQNLYISIVIVVAAIAMTVYLIRRDVSVPNTPVSESTEPQTEKSFTLACENSKGLMVTFHLPDDKFIDVLASDGRTFELFNTSGPDQASYTSVDKRTSLVLEGSALKLTEGSKTTYAGCVLDTPVTE